MGKITRRGIRPAFRLVFDTSADPGMLHRVFRFRRNWVAIAFIAAFDAAFLFPAFAAFQQAADDWSRLDNLFDLTGALFMTGWLLGWSIAPLVLTAVLLMMLFGREVLRARPGEVEIIIGLPGLGAGRVYRVDGMRNLRLVQPEKPSGTDWRGQHAVFDYGANEAAFGTQLEAPDLAAIQSGIRLATGQALRQGDAKPGETEGEWPADRMKTLLARRDGEHAPATGPESAAKRPTRLASPSTLLLILANLVPVFGAGFLGWRLADVMVLYWAESAVVGFYNVLKLITIGRWFALLTVPFFIGHFGAFMAVHFLFLYGIFIEGPNRLSSGDLGEVATLFVGLWPGLAALVVSHGFSFLHNFLGRHEYAGRSLRTQMTEPYGRIVFMHLVLIFGGGLTLVLGEPAPVLIIVIALKVALDVRAHLRQRQRG